MCVCVCVIVIGVQSVRGNNFLAVKIKERDVPGFSAGCKVRHH